MPTQLVYIGTYTRAEPHVQGTGAGIYMYAFDPATGVLTLRHTTDGIVNPSFLALAPSGRYLYAVQEGDPGLVSAFAVDHQTGALTHLNDQSTHGSAPCYVSVDASERCVLVANYGSGNVAAFPINADGSLAPAASTHQHSGSSVNTDRQAGPHAHSIVVDPANRFAVAADLGTDQIMIYRLDPATAQLTPHDPPFVAVDPGAGPRHFVFDPGSAYAYLINELASTVTVFAYDPARGMLDQIQTINALPADFAGESTAADIHIDPAGAFVYSSNRGHDSIASFAVDQTTGQLRALDHTPTRGRTPRNFAIDPTGAWLLAANQDSHTITVFRRDPATGGLAPTDHMIHVPSPVCIQWAPIAAENA